MIVQVTNNFLEYWNIAIFKKIYDPLVQVTNNFLEYWNNFFPCTAGKLVVQVTNNFLEYWNVAIMSCFETSLYKWPITF